MSQDNVTHQLSYEKVHMDMKSRDMAKRQSRNVEHLNV